MFLKSFNDFKNDDRPFLERRGRLKENGFTFNKDNIKEFRYDSTLNVKKQNCFFSNNKNSLSKETIIKDKSGYLFSNKNPSDLVDLIVTIMQKDYNSLKSIGIEGRKNVLKKFDVDKMCQTTFTEYKKLIELS